MSRIKKSEKLEWIERVRRIKEDQPLVDETALAIAEAPLVAELRALGLPVRSVWDLVNTKETYPESVPVLLAHLRKPYPRRILEGIARALAVPQARIGWDPLVRQYCEAYELDKWRNVNELKWSLHLALSAAADKSVLDELISLACDRRHGEHRSFFADALARIGGARAIAALAELRRDPHFKAAFERLDKKAKKRRSK